MTRRFLADETETARFGAELAGTLEPGDLVLLEGDLGAGKTALARAVIRALLGDPLHEVPSPTFALVQPYRGATAILHADLYRIADPREIDELGLFEDPDAIVLVEWAERAPELSARAALRIELSIPPGGVGRIATVSRPGAAAADGSPAG